MLGTFSSCCGAPLGALVPAGFEQAQARTCNSNTESKSPLNSTRGRRPSATSKSDAGKGRHGTTCGREMRPRHSACSNSPGAWFAIWEMETPPVQPLKNLQNYSPLEYLPTPKIFWNENSKKKTCEKPHFHISTERWSIFLNSKPTPHHLNLPAL